VPRADPTPTRAPAWCVFPSREVTSRGHQGLREERHDEGPTVDVGRLVGKRVEFAGQPCGRGRGPDPGGRRRSGHDPERPAGQPPRQRGTRRPCRAPCAKRLPAQAHPQHPRFLRPERRQQPELRDRRDPAPSDGDGAAGHRRDRDGAQSARELLQYRHDLHREPASAPRLRTRGRPPPTHQRGGPPQRRLAPGVLRAAAGGCRRGPRLLSDRGPAGARGGRAKEPRSVAKAPGGPRGGLRGEARGRQGLPARRLQGATARDPGRRPASRRPDRGRGLQGPAPEPDVTRPRLRLPGRAGGPDRHRADPGGSRGLPGSRAAARGADGRGSRRRCRARRVVLPESAPSTAGPQPGPHPSRDGRQLPASDRASGSIAFTSPLSSPSRCPSTARRR